MQDFKEIFLFQGDTSGYAPDLPLKFILPPSSGLLQRESLTKPESTELFEMWQILIDVVSNPQQLKHLGLSQMPEIL